MFRTTCETVRVSPATSGNPVVMERLDAFEAKLEHIDQLDAKQAQSVGRGLSERNGAFGAMVQDALLLSGLGLSFAKANALESLARDLRFVPSDFSHVRFDRRLHMCRQVATTLRDDLAQLAGSGITPAMLDAFDAKIAAATALVDKPRSTIVSKRAATEQLRSAFREADDMLTTWLDPLIMPLKVTDPEFYARYRAAREIVDRPASHSGAPEAQAMRDATVRSSAAQPLAA